MSIESALRAHLIANAGVTAIVGSRVYMKHAPTTATYPYIVMHKIGKRPSRHSLAACGLCDHSFQLDCWAQTDKAAKDLADEIRDGLDHYQGTLGSGGETIYAHVVRYINDYDDFDNPSDASEQGEYRTIVELRIWHAETVPSLT